MKKSTKKIIIGATVACLACSILTPGIAVTIVKNSNHKIKDEIGEFNFNGKTFTSKNELISYALQNAEIYTDKVDMPNQWSLRINGKEEFFNSPLEVEEFLSKNIHEINVASSSEIQESPIGEIYPSQLEKISASNAETTTVYRGKNNTIYTSLEKAKDSYLEIHDAYVFQNKYFRTKEELGSYLSKNKEEFKQGKKLKTIVLQTPSGFKSNPIEIDDIINNDPHTDKYLRKFIKQNVESYFSLDVDMGLEDIDRKYYEDISDIEDENYDPSFTQITSNQGKGNYIIDTEKTDEATLYGPYYVKSSDSILGIKDKKNWRKIKGNDTPFFEEIRKPSIISAFFNLILSDNSSNGSAEIFNTNDKLDAEIKNYFSILRDSQRRIYDSVNELFQTIKRGKRFGEFYKLPILFNHTIDQMVYNSSPQKYIDLTRDIYTKICKFYDEQLYSLIPSALLFDVTGKEKFSFVNFFGTNNQNLDINYDITTLSTILVDKYPVLYQTINFFNVAYANLNQTSNVVFIGNDSELTHDWLQKYTGVTLEKTFAKEYALLFKLIKCKDPFEFIRICKQINPEYKQIKSSFAITNFVINYCKDKVLERIIGFFINPEGETKKHNYNDEQKNILKSFKFLSFSPENGQCTSSRETSKYNHEFIRYWYNKNRGVDTTVFMNLAILMKINPLLKFPKGWKSMSIEQLNQEVVRRIKIADSGILNKIGYVAKKVDEVLDCLNTNNYIHFSAILMPNIIRDIKEILNVENIEDDVNHVWKCLGDILEFSKDVMLKVIKSLSGIAFKIKDLVQISAIIFKKVPKLGMILNIVNIVVKLIANIHKTEYYSYVFETGDGIKYVWDGGVEESWLFGIIKGNVSNLSSMQLLEPKQVIKPNIYNGHYYNGKIFDDFNALKRKQINDILNNRYESPKINTVYAFEKIINNNLRKYFSKDLEELTENVIKDIKEYAKDTTIEENKPSFIGKNTYTFANGFDYDSKLSEIENISKLIDNIKPTKVATLPILNNNPDNTDEINTSLNAIKPESKNKMPIYRDDALEDHSLPNYVLPGTSWNPQSGLVKNETNNNYVIVDPNSTDNKNLSENAIKNKLKRNFYSYFDVDSKIVLKDDLINHNLFSELSTNIERKSIYWVKGKFNQVKIFSSKYAALKWLLNSYDFKVYNEVNKIETYVYDGKRFENINEFIRWVVATSKGEINEKEN